MNDLEPVEAVLQRFHLRALRAEAQRDTLGKKKVAIVGSREGVSRLRVGAYVCSLPKDTIIVSGGARGVDQAAEFYAKHAGLEIIVFPAEWDKYGKRAGFVRNKLIVDAADRIVAFWDGASKGTKHTIDLALKQGKPVEVIR